MEQTFSPRTFIRPSSLLLLVASTSLSADAAIFQQNGNLLSQAEEGLHSNAGNMSAPTVPPTLPDFNQTFHLVVQQSNASSMSSYSSACEFNSSRCINNDTLTGTHCKTNGNCTNAANSNRLSQLVHSLPFLPILIVMAVMFVCLCLVLRLFGKARFHNKPSSFFANPEALKVAQAQERRLSQLSQFSGGRTPRTPRRSPVHSYRTPRSSLNSSSNVYPINEPISPRSHNSVLLKEKLRSNSISSSKLLP